ncbi:hypothetical protein [Acinetobacter sp.]|jgi:hypothetical protein|uniref:hypothetical protein n=1 Tax=Acinetobacter sp. TaxID=472 RepID=UPI0028350C4C|nr:hypothetical protein [Acinetobacter sp.]MDR0236148.1 hypothetical protein [Acinetobacter sp.]
MIPYQIRATLLQLEPSTDLNWEKVLYDIFDDANIEVREEIDRQILKPKEIQWNRVENTFEFKITNSLELLRHRLDNERMRSIANKLSNSLLWLKKINDCVQIADYIENTLQQIDLIPVEERLSFQREKLLIRRVFLQDVAELIRTLDIQVPPNIRNLTADQIKCFIIEVFIKQQLLGYWFKPLLAKSSELRAHPFFKYFILSEQKVRKFDIVQTSEFIYLIAPIQQFEQNPYSIRRFLFEERIEYNNQVYVTGLVLDLKRISENLYREETDELIHKMVTIQHQVHRDVIEIVQEFESFTENKLLPFLMQPLGMVGKNSDLVAQNHIKTIEQMLIANVLMPLRNAVKNDLSHLEEFEYLFMSIHRIFSEILSHYRDFKEQPALFFNAHVQLFEYRLLAYLKLLEKRKDEIFIPMSKQEWQVMHERSQQPIKKLQEIMLNQAKDYNELQSYIQQLKLEQNEVQGSLFKKIVKGGKVEKDMSQAKHAALLIKKQTYLELLNVPKGLSKYSVFIEFESLTSLSELERHYAFPSGDNGIIRFPFLMKIPENLADFNFEAFHASIYMD